MPCPDVFVQDVPAALTRKGLCFTCYLDPGREAILDAAHMVRVNYETYFFADTASRALFEGDVVRSRGFRLRTPPTRSEIAVAVFGPSTLNWGARHAPRLVLNLLTEAAIQRLCRRIAEVAEAALRPDPHACLWQPVAFGPTTELSDESRRQVAAQLSAYLAAPGYRDLFIEAGAPDLVQRAIAGEPRAGLAGEAMDSFAHDVAVDLVGSACDRL